MEIPIHLIQDIELVSATDVYLFLKLPNWNRMQYGTVKGQSCTLIHFRQQKNMGFAVTGTN